MEQAQTAQERFRAKGGKVRGPFFEWVALHELDELEKRFDAGDRWALMLGIRKCANFDLVMPEWLACAYIKAFDTVNNHRVKSWDDVFGPPLTKGAQLSARRKKREKSVHVWNEVQSHLLAEQVWNEKTRQWESARPIDDELFTKVGEKLGLGLTLTKTYYTEWKNLNQSSRRKK